VSGCIPRLFQSQIADRNAFEISTYCTLYRYLSVVILFSKYGHRGRLLALAATDPRGEVTIRVDHKSYGKSSLTGEIDGRIYGSVPATPGTCQGVCHLLWESAPGTSIHTMFLGSFSLSDYFLVTIRHHSVSWIWRAHRIGYPIVWAYPLSPLKIRLGGDVGSGLVVVGSTV
jgi:hypothetical protein